MFSYLLGKTTLIHNISGDFNPDEEEEEEEDNNKPFEGMHYEEMDDQEYVQAVEERLQRGKGEGMQAKQELMEALEDKE